MVIHGNVAIVASQSCDIANNRLEDDPCVAVLIGQTVNEQKEEYAFNKHPRILHVTLKRKTDNEEVFEDIPAQFKAFQKIHIPKDVFINLSPSTQLLLVNQDLSSFVSWLAARYSRPALPTAFNHRIEKADHKRKRRKTAKSLDVSLTGLYIEIIPDAEINDDQDYAVNFLGLVPVNYNGDLEEVKQLVHNIAEVMMAAGMDVKFEVLREDEVSIAMLRRFKRFYYDDLSIRNNNTLPPEIELHL